MCGIAGFWEFEAHRNSEQLEQVAHAMANSIVSRGPDDHGTWVTADDGLALSHRRLSIIDTSACGHQPMVSSCGNYVICYNGEIYNFRQLRDTLSEGGVTFKGKSDTEVLLNACIAWGVEAAIDKCIGMFAFAFWDVRQQELTLVRDRLGIKPLYWYQDDHRLVFASQSKAMRHYKTEHNAPAWHVDRHSLAMFIRLGYVPAPMSIYEGARQLPPGHMLRIKSGAEPELQRYWTIPHMAPNPEVTYDGAKVHLQSLLEDAVAKRMVSDVPIGAFLSGGIDSSLVVALMQAQSDKPVRSFSVGFDEKGFDEAPYAAKIARHLGTEHTELRVTSQDALHLVPSLAGAYDEPFADSSQLPTMLLSKLTRNYVTVALSGDGGDEVFAGYNRYLMAKTSIRILFRSGLNLKYLF